MPSFFQTLLRPDQEENEDRSLVAKAANILEVGEFQLLQLAYYEAFGNDLPESGADDLFRSFMMHNVVPAWARNFAEKVLDHEARGELNDRHPYFHRYDSDYFQATPLGARSLAIAVCAVALVLGGGIAVGHMATAKAVVEAPNGQTEQVSRPTSVLPPFWSEEELQPRRRTDLRGS